MTLARLLTALALAAAAAGCGTGGGSEAPSGSWQLTSGTGPAGPLDTPPAHRITLVLEDERVGGTAACNSYGGPVEIEGDRIVVGGLAVTEIACEPPRVMAAEAAYLDALGLIDTIRREELLLVLTGPSVELRFEPLAPVPARQLLGTRWELDTVIRGDVASTPAAAATLRLDGGGGLVGETGCRPLRGRYVLRGDEIRVTELAADEAPEAGGCLAAVVEQDRLVLDVLGDGFRVAVEGDRLTLTSSGPDALVYRAP